ncbi:MAG TPA: AMP-binding protein [Caulobacteraceae bacterium]
MHPAVRARTEPEKTAFTMAGSGRAVTFRELDERSNQIAHLLRGIGLRRGDRISLLGENSAEFVLVCCAAARAGLYYAPIGTSLTPGEIGHIVTDSEARAMFAGVAMADKAREAAGAAVGLAGRYSLGGEIAGFEKLDDAVAGLPTTPIADESEGLDLLYSSGTTGRPKGILRPLTDRPLDAPDASTQAYASLWGMGDDTVYLSPAPLYHAAPLRFLMGVMAQGGSAVIMEHFDAESALGLIERHRVTHSQWVPTMFVRLLKLPEAMRRRFDLGSHKAAIHGAAPCPISVKREMIAWWGPILFEYYGGTEAIGSCAINSDEWLRHQGSVGRPMVGKIHLVGTDGAELPAGEEGLVYFSDGGPRFEYLNDEAKTREIEQADGWRTFGDVGRVDAEGYLYLTDRASNLIISGGVNIYPQETENLLVTHPKVAEAAVIGVPNEEFGEEVRAVVQPASWDTPTHELAAELIAYCRQHLSPIKCPRAIDFDPAVPRGENGKLYKRRLRDRYWAGRSSRLV